MGIFKKTYNWLTSSEPDWPPYDSTKKAIVDKISDHRRFAWIDAKQYAKEGGQSALVPVILHDKLLCGEARQHVMFECEIDPADYELTLDELKEKFPAPQRSDT